MQNILKGSIALFSDFNAKYLIVHTFLVSFPNPHKYGSI